MKSLGFTLLELLTSLAILSILMLVGVPSLSSQLQSSKLSNTTQSLYEAISFARSQAVLSNKRVTIRNVGKWENGWEIFIDSNNNGNRDADEKLLSVHEKIPGMQIKANSRVAKYISFISTGESKLVKNDFGGGFQAGTLTICPTTGDGSSLILAPGGRARIKAVKETKCI